MGRRAGFRVLKGCCTECRILKLLIKDQQQVLLQLVGHVESLFSSMEKARIDIPSIRAPHSQQAADNSQMIVESCNTRVPETSMISPDMEIERPQRQKRRRRHRSGRKKKKTKIVWIETPAAPLTLSKAHRKGRNP